MTLFATFPKASASLPGLLVCLLALVSLKPALAKECSILSADTAKVDARYQRKPEYKFIHLLRTSSKIRRGNSFLHVYDWRKKDPMSRAPKFITEYGEGVTYRADTFARELYPIFVDHGYVDTVHANFQTSNTTVFMQADMHSRTLYRISAKPNSGYSGLEQWQAKVKAVWKVLGLDGKAIDSVTTEGATPHMEVPGFTGSVGEQDQKAFIKKLTRLAMTDALIRLNEDPTFAKYLVRTAKDEEAILKENQVLTLDKPKIAAESQKLGTYIKSGVTVVTKTGHGSGFFLTPDGLVVTNFHVVDNSPTDLNLLLNNGDKVKATLVRYSTKHDLALLKVDLKDQQALPLADGEPEVGTEVWAIGTPKSIELGQTVSKGILSAVRRKEKEGVFLQTDVAVNPGNSGGALLTSDGQVLGVVTFKARATHGVNFAIPAKTVFQALKLEYRPAEQPQVPPAIKTPESVPAPITLPGTAPAKAVKGKN